MAKKQNNDDEDECEVCGSEDHTTDEHDSASKADDTSGGDKEAKKADDTSGGDKEARKTGKSGDKPDGGDDEENDDDEDDNKDTSKLDGEESPGNKAGRAAKLAGEESPGNTAGKARKAGGSADDCDDDMSKGAPANADPSDYAHVPDPDHPSTWKLNISDARHVGGAVAALGPGGFRGQKADIPDKDLPKVKAKVRAAYKKHNPDKELPEVLKSTTTPEQLEAMLGSLSKRMESTLEKGA